MNDMPVPPGRGGQRAVDALVFAVVVVLLGIVAAWLLVYAP